MDNNKKYIDCGVLHKEINDAERSITHYITTPDRDRSGECIDPYGMIDNDFRKAPSVFYNHNYNMPVAKSLWRKATDKGVLAKTKFGSTETAKDIYMLHKEDIIRTWSIGFRIPDGNDTVKWDEASKTMFIKRWELIEYSSAPVAMNPNCLDQMKKIVKSHELLGEIERQESFIKINEMLSSFKSELRSLYDDQRELEEKIKMLLNEAAGTAGKNISRDEIGKMFAGAVSSITGRKIKVKREK